jgi:hypothetical protein
VIGRPPKSVAEKQSFKVVLHLTPAEGKRLAKAAARAKVPIATLARLRVTQGKA